MNNAGPYNVRKPTVDDVARELQDRALSTAQSLRRDAQQIENTVVKERRENAWAAEHVRALSDWQRDAIYRLLSKMNEED